MLTLGVSSEQANMVLNLEIYTLGIISMSVKNSVLIINCI